MQDLEYNRFLSIKFKNEQKYLSRKLEINNLKIIMKRTYFTENDISVLLPYREGDNLEKFKKAFDSITIYQTKKVHIIFICIDGNIHKSTDEFINILIESCKNRNINCTKIFNKNEKGLAANLNNGLSQVKTPLFIRLDSDDFSFSDRISNSLKLMNSDNKCAVIGGNCLIYDTFQKSYKLRKYPSLISYKGIYFKNNIFNYLFSKLMFLRNPLAHSCVMARTNVIKNLGGYPEDFKYVQDHALWIKVLYKKFNIRNSEAVFSCIEYSPRNIYKRNIEYLNYEIRIINILRKKGLINFTYKYFFIFLRISYRGFYLLKSKFSKK